VKKEIIVIVEKPSQPSTSLTKTKYSTNTSNNGYEESKRIRFKRQSFGGVTEESSVDKESVAGIVNAIGDHSSDYHSNKCRQPDVIKKRKGMNRVGGISTEPKSANTLQ
jgi:hypothetical protein